MQAAEMQVSERGEPAYFRGMCALQKGRVSDYPDSNALQQEKAILMGRSVRAELMDADHHLARFVRYQRAEFERLGYPKQAAFAKEVSLGTISVPPVQDDPEMDIAGSYFWSLNDIKRRILLDRYGGEGTEIMRARRVSMSVHRLRVEIDRLLTNFAGYLQGRMH